MNNLIAKRYIKNINTGISKPILMESFNNKTYVIKYIGNKISDKILINDFICSRLAQKLNIMVPDVEIIFIPEELIEIEIELQKLGIKPGNHFGSLYYNETIAFTGEEVLKIIDNKDQVPKIIAFDFLVGNDDRTDNLGNLLISTSKNKMNIIAIDYGNAFNGPAWIIEDLLDLEINIIPSDGAVYSSLFQQIKNINCFNEICNTIEAIKIKDIESILDQIPLEWGLNKDERILIIQYFINRKDKIRDTMKYIVEEKLKI